MYSGLMKSCISRRRTALTGSRACLAAASQDFLNNLYANGLTAKATLEYTGDLNEDAKRKLIQAFETYGAGTKNTGRILPIPQGMKLTPLDIKLSDSQFIELKKYSALQIAAAFGIKPNQINDYEKSSYANSEMQQLSFYVDTMLFVLKQYEEEVNWKLLTDTERYDEGKYYKLNEKAILRTDSKTQMEIMAQAIQNGIEKPNECRRKLDLKDSEGGDQLIVNGSFLPLKDVGIQYAQNQPQQAAQPQRRRSADNAGPEDVHAPAPGTPAGTDPEDTAETDPEEAQEGGNDDGEQVPVHAEESED